MIHGEGYIPTWKVIVAGLFCVVVFIAWVVILSRAVD